MLVSLVYLLKEVFSDSFLVRDSNSTIDDRVYLGESYTLRYLDAPINILANTSINANLHFYKSARIFNGKSMYTFPIAHMGRYFIRFHFFPFTYKNYNLSNAKFDVIVDRFELIKNYTPPTCETIKEYSINVSSTSIEIVLAPTSKFVAFLNALEVFLIPNALIQDNATLIHSKRSYIGLHNAALETIFRINMREPSVSHNKDTLWRTWKPDDSFLKSKTFFAKVQNIGIVHNMSTGSYFAPIVVYDTCRRLTTENNLNMTCIFNVDLGFQYLARLHFCDIVRKKHDF